MLQGVYADPFTLWSFAILPSCNYLPVCISLSVHAANALAQCQPLVSLSWLLEPALLQGLSACTLMLCLDVNSTETVISSRKYACCKKHLLTTDCFDIMHAWRQADSRSASSVGTVHSRLAWQRLQAYRILYPCRCTLLGTDNKLVVSQPAQSTLYTADCNGSACKHTGHHYFTDV